jgi:hypothetical protein
LFSILELHFLKGYPMKVYRCKRRFFCAPLKRYIPVDAKVCRWEKVSKIVLNVVPEINDINNLVYTGMEYDNPQLVAWISEVEPPPLGNNETWFELIGSYEENEDGVIGADGATGPTGPQGLIGPTGPIGLQGPQGNYYELGLGLEESIDGKLQLKKDISSGANVVPLALSNNGAGLQIDNQTLRNEYGVLLVGQLDCGSI